MMRKICLPLFVWCLVLLLASCSPVSMPEPAKYTLSPGKQVSNKRVSRTRATILVARPIAASGFSGKSMLYMMTPYRLQSYAHHEWVAPPAQMLLPIVVQALRRRNYFAAVSAPPFSGKTDYQLNTYLVELDQSFLRPVSQVHLVVQATLVDMRSRKVVAARSFVRNQAATGNNPYSGVLAANRAASWVSRQIAGFVVRNTHSA